jgi:hypothetical protein
MTSLESTPAPHPPVISLEVHTRVLVFNNIRQLKIGTAYNAHGEMMSVRNDTYIEEITKIEEELVGNNRRFRPTQNGTIRDLFELHNGMIRITNHMHNVMYLPNNLTYKVRLTVIYFRK